MFPEMKLIKNIFILKCLSLIVKNTEMMDLFKRSRLLSGLYLLQEP